MRARNRVFKYRRPEVFLTGIILVPSFENFRHRLVEKYLGLKNEGDNSRQRGHVRTPMISNLSRSHLGLYALCGVIAPIFFVLMVILEGFLVTGYSHISQQVSDLGAYTMYGSYALLQNLNFCVFGILTVAFAIGLRHELPASRVITTTLGLCGVLFFLLGFFPDEPTPWPAAAHYLIAQLSGLSILLSQFFAWRRLRRPVAGEGVGWTKYSRFSLVSLVLAIISFIVFATFGQPGSPITGLLQRVMGTFILLWIEVMALRLLRLSKA
jgi:hypothetical membrane protein